MHLLFMLLLLLFSTAAFAHSGRTDGSGGHHDRKHGGYHYHHGMSAHDHDNGVCPYAPQKRAVKEEDTEKAKIEASPKAEEIAKPRESEKIVKDNGNSEAAAAVGSDETHNDRNTGPDKESESSSNTGWYILGGSALFVGYRWLQKGQGKRN